MAYTKEAFRQDRQGRSGLAPVHVASLSQPTGVSLGSGTLEQFSGETYPGCQRLWRPPLGLPHPKAQALRAWRAQVLKREKGKAVRRECGAGVGGQAGRVWGVGRAGAQRRREEARVWT